MNEATRPDFCPQGCYWECEHRTPSLAAMMERAGLRPAEEAGGRSLSRCGECGEYFADSVEHAREHQRLRQLGWLPEGGAAGWPGTQRGSRPRRRKGRASWR
jgi:hypothetical protein